MHVKKYFSNMNEAADRVGGRWEGVGRGSGGRRRGGVGGRRGGGRGRKIGGKGKEGKRVNIARSKREGARTETRWWERGSG